MNFMTFLSRLSGNFILLALFASRATLAQEGSETIAKNDLSTSDQYEARWASLPADPEFSELREMRNGIVQAIPRLQAEVDTQRSELAGLRQREATMRAELEGLGVREQEQFDAVIADMEYFEQQIRDIDQELASSDESNPQLEERRDMITTQLRGATAEYTRLQRNLSRLEERETTIGAELDSVQSKIEVALDGLERKNQDLISLREIQSRIDDQINTLLIPETAQNEFKLWVTAAFSVLVGIVIIGFFVIAGFDETVRQSIFSSQSGIQFLTLFSLVIAIILFGITGILEGKELSALLGGLSGYILGRVGSNLDRVGGSTPSPSHGT